MNPAPAPDRFGKQSFNMTFWLGLKVEVFTDLDGTLREHVLEWVKQCEQHQKPWVAGRFLFGTEMCIRPNAVKETKHILQFCGDLSEDPMDEAALMAVLQDLAAYLCPKLDMTFARIRICETTREDAYFSPRPAGASAEEPPPAS
jgi:hypothetical protein